MRKYLLLFLINLLCAPAFAGLVSVKSMEDFSTKNPPKTVKVEVVKPFNLSKDLRFEKGDIIEGEIKVKAPKRLKRNASFSLNNLYYAGNGSEFEPLKKYNANYFKPISAGDVAKGAAKKATNAVVPGISTGYSVIKEIKANEEGNLAKSTVVSLYDNSPLSFFSKGKDLEIKKEDTFDLFFKKSKK